MVLSWALKFHPCQIGMDRLNGGFYPEAVSGGQWTTLYQFYNQIRQACAQDDLEVIFFLDGTSAKSLEEQEEWLYKQFRISRQVKILYESFSPLRKPHSRHFTQPIFLADWIRYNANNIRANEPKNTFSFQSIDDHQMEILDFSRQFKCDILFTNDLNVIALYLINQKFASRLHLLVALLPGSLNCSAKIAREQFFIFQREK